jgi:hypothetical protein
MPPQESDEPAFAVIVNPRSWRDSNARLAEVVIERLGSLMGLGNLPGVPEFETLLDAGPATILDGLERAQAAQLVELFSKDGIECKISRSVVSKPRKTPFRSTLTDGWRPKMTVQEDKAIAAKPRKGTESTCKATEPPPRGSGVDPRPTRVSWDDVVPQTAEELGEHASPRPVGPEPIPKAASVAQSAGKPAAEEEATPYKKKWNMESAAAALEEKEPPGTPIPVDKLVPNIALTRLFGILAPGAGHRYLGRPEAALGYAMSAPLVVPWIRAVREATEIARSINEDHERARTRVAPVAAARFAAVFWMAVATLVVGCVLLYSNLLDNSRTTAVLDVPATSEEGSRTSPADVTSALGPAAEATGEGTGGSSAVAAEIDRRQRRARAQRTLIQARLACNSEAFERCAELASRARENDPESTAAVRMYHEAIVSLGEQTMEPEGTGQTPEETPP